MIITPPLHNPVRSTRYRFLHLARRIMVGGVACLLLAGGGFFAFHVYQQQRYIEMAAAVEINTF